ncbi:hypothetical protein L3N51_02134 [Metallosphaera sp. J1]|nr:hypothetical protein [Metallosphaera javensis (ex Hofmann et al. 2022)]
MKSYFTIKQTSNCPTNYGLYECSITSEGENCRLLACVVPRLATPLSMDDMRPLF